MTTASKVKWALLLLCALMLIILAFQNLDEIEVRILFWTIRLPQAVVLAAAVAGGFLMGLLAKALWKVRGWQIRHRGSRKEKQDEAEQAEIERR